MRVSSAIAVFLCALVASAAHGQIAVSCPDTVPVTQSAKEPPPGWEVALDDAPHSMQTVTFYDGPPDEKMSLVNQTTQRTKGMDVATWDFGKSKARPVWIRCGYVGTSVTLSQKLPVEVHSCSVTYNRRQQIGGLPKIDRIVCR